MFNNFRTSNAAKAKLMKSKKGDLRHDVVKIKTDYLRNFVAKN